MRALCDSYALFQRAHLKLHTSHCTLHTSNFAVTLHFPLCLISSHLNSSHLISALLTSSHLSHLLAKFFSTIFISSEHGSTLLISLKLFSTHLSSCARQKDFTVTEKFLPHKSQCAQKALAHRSLTHGCFCTEKPWHTGASVHEKCSHREAFTHRSFYTHQTFTQRSFYTQQAFPNTKM